MSFDELILHFLNLNEVELREGDLLPFSYWKEEGVFVIRLKYTDINLNPCKFIKLSLKTNGQCYSMNTDKITMKFMDSLPFIRRVNTSKRGFKWVYYHDLDIQSMMDDIEICLKNQKGYINRIKRDKKLKDLGI